jgi:hypothetical protein
VVHKKKIAIWYLLPANQLLLYACFSALRIDTACYTSELSRHERANFVKAFTENPDCRIFIGSWYVGSTGLNLQRQCNHNVEFDSPPNIGAMTQARRRSRRIGQHFAVENFELSVENSFQNRVINDMISKSLPGAMAELTLNVGEVEVTFGDDEKLVDIGRCFLINNELIRAPDPRVNHLSKKDELSPKAF